MKSKTTFIAEICGRETMSNWLGEYIDALHFNKNLIVLSATNVGVPIASFANGIGAFVGIASACFSFVCSRTTGIIKKLLKTIRNQKKKHNKIVVLARSKLNIVKTMITKALIDSEIGSEEYTTIINEEEKYRRLEEDIRMMKSQRSNAEKDKLFKKGRRIGIDYLVK